MIGAVLVAVINILMAAVGWRYLFQTDKVVADAQARQQKKKLTQLSLNSSMSMKSWYPTLIRCSGVAIWVFDLFLIYMVWFWKPAP
jgi:hypothetical protein